MSPRNAPTTGMKGTTGRGGKPSDADSRSFRTATVRRPREVMEPDNRRGKGTGIRPGRIPRYCNDDKRYGPEKARTGHSHRDGRTRATEFDSEAGGNNSSEPFNANSGICSRHEMEDRLRPIGGRQRTDRDRTGIESQSGRRVRFNGSVIKGKRSIS